MMALADVELETLVFTIVHNMQQYMFSQYRSFSIACLIDLFSSRDCAEKHRRNSRAANRT